MNNDQIKDLQIKILQNQELSPEDLARLESCPEAIEFKNIVDSISLEVSDIEPPKEIDLAIKSYAQENISARPILSFRFMALAATLLLAFIVFAFFKPTTENPANINSDDNLAEKKAKKLKLEPAEKAVKKEFQVNLEQILDSDFDAEFDFIESELDSMDMNNRMEDYLAFTADE